MPLCVGSTVQLSSNNYSAIALSDQASQLMRLTDIESIYIDSDVISDITTDLKMDGLLKFAGINNIYIDNMNIYGLNLASVINAKTNLLYLTFSSFWSIKGLLLRTTTPIEHLKL